MPKPPRPAYICRACRRSLVGYSPADEKTGLPQVCSECWGKMSPGERAARIEADLQVDLLREIRSQLDLLNLNSENDENQLGSIARAFENFGRILRPASGEFDDVMGELKKLLRMLQQRAERANERDGDGDEPWRESLRE